MRIWFMPMFVRPAGSAPNMSTTVCRVGYSRGQLVVMVGFGARLPWRVNDCTSSRSESSGTADAEAAHAKAHGDSMRAMSHGLLEAVAKHNREEEARREAAAWELSLALFAKQRREAKMWFDLRPHFEKTTKWQKRRYEQCCCLVEIC